MKKESDEYRATLLACAKEIDGLNKEGNDIYETSDDASKSWAAKETLNTDEEGSEHSKIKSDSSKSYYSPRENKGNKNNPGSERLTRNWEQSIKTSSLGGTDMKDVPCGETVNERRKEAMRSLITAEIQSLQLTNISDESLRKDTFRHVLSNASYRQCTTPSSLDDTRTIKSARSVSSRKGSSRSRASSRHDSKSAGADEGKPFLMVSSRQAMRQLGSRRVSIPLQVTTSPREGKLITGLTTNHKYASTGHLTISHLLRLKEKKEASYTYTRDILNSTAHLRRNKYSNGISSYMQK